MTGCKGLFANSQRPRNKAQQAWSAPFSHHNPDLIHHMSPWVTILEICFIAPHFPLPALSLKPFCFSASDPGSFPFLWMAQSLFHYFVTWSGVLSGPGSRPTGAVDGLLIDRLYGKHAALFDLNHLGNIHFCDSKPVLSRVIRRVKVNSTNDMI